MDVGVVKEIKDRENRVALTPTGARVLVSAGHRVSVEAGAGAGSGFSDAAYRAAGCSIVTAEQAWDATLVVKIKEPLACEYPYLKEQILFTYLHLAGVDPALTEALLSAGTTALGYETVEDAQGRRPLLAPMSAVAGNMAIAVGNYYLARFSGGKGLLLGTVLGKHFGKVVILGDGVVGRHAARVADSLGAHTVIFTRHLERETVLKQAVSEQLRVAQSSPEAIAGEVADCDLLVGAVLHPGGRAPLLVPEVVVARMEPGSVIVDVSIDQGGCIATSRPTSHSDPVYQLHGVTHYCVTNMPGAYPRTSTIALTDATLTYIERLAARGFSVLREDAGFARGVNTCRGYITCRPVAESLQLLPGFRPLEQVLNGPEGAEAAGR